MARHSFIQMSKLPNVKGRISYITSHAKQENLYATYRTTDNTFWNNLARESQQEFLRSGTTGKGIEARELIIALPEIYTTFDPQQVLEEFTNKFRQQYGVECVSALHHNKRKTNYHIHLIFSERKLLPEPDIKIATRSVFYDETGKRVRTKKEITDENGQVRKGCTVIKKGEVYESHLFTTKDERFKTEAFIAEAKEVYTELINSHISDPEQRLKVFDKNSVYLPTKKIGKNNPKATEIEADNTARQEWNRTADLALVSGIEEAKILEIKQTEIHDKAGQSIRENGWFPNLFRGIVGKAKEFLQAIIREKDMPPKPVLNMDMDEFRTMQTLMLKVQKQAKAIKKIGRAQNCAVLLHPGFGQIPQLSGRYDLHTTHPNAVSPSRPHTQRTFACACALPYGRVCKHFFAERHLLVRAGHHAFPRNFLFHHRAEHGTVKGYVQG